MHCSPCSTAVDILTLLEEKATGATFRVSSSRRAIASYQVDLVARRVTLCEDRCMDECGVGTDHTAGPRRTPRRITPGQAVAELKELALDTNGDLEGKAAVALTKEVEDGVATREVEAKQAEDDAEKNSNVAVSSRKTSEKGMQHELQRFHDEALHLAEASEEKIAHAHVVLQQDLAKALNASVAGSVSADEGIAVKQTASPVFDIDAVVKQADQEVAKEVQQSERRHPTTPEVMTSEVTGSTKTWTFGGPIASSLLQVQQDEGHGVGHGVRVRTQARSTPVVGAVVGGSMSAALRSAVMAAVTKEHGHKASDHLEHKKLSNVNGVKEPSPKESSSRSKGEELASAGKVLHRLREGGSRHRGARHGHKLVAPSYADQDDDDDNNDGNSDEDGSTDDSRNDSSESGDDSGDDDKEVFARHRFRSLHRHGKARHRANADGKAGAKADAGAGSPWWLNPPPWWLPPPPEWGSPPPSVYSPFYSPYSIPQPFHASPAHNAYPAYTPTPLPY